MRSPDLLDNVKIGQVSLGLLFKHVYHNGRGIHIGHVTRSICIKFWLTFEI